jgi:hypothetical protein
MGVLDSADGLFFLRVVCEMGYRLWTNTVAGLPSELLLLCRLLKLGVVHCQFGFKSRFLRQPFFLLQSVVLGMIPCELGLFY